MGRGRCKNSVGKQRSGEGLLEDADLVSRAQAGDVQAYEQLVQRFQEIAFRAAYLVTGDAQDAEDAAQEAFVRAYYALPRFRRGAPFRPWLLQIVVNEARNRRKATGRRVRLAFRAAEQESQTASGSPPDEMIVRLEARHFLLKALSDLGDDDRLVITSRYFLELSEAEMAEALGCPRGTVKSRLSRAMARLRNAVERMTASLEEARG